MYYFTITETNHIKNYKNNVDKKILKIENNYITTQLFEDWYGTYYGCIEKLEEFITNNFNAVYNEEDKNYYIDNEPVYKLGDDSFTYEGITYSVVDINNIDITEYEYCNECDNEQLIVSSFAPQICPECGKIIMPCTLCEECVKNCPLVELKKYLQETNNEIIFIDGEMRLNGIYYQNLFDILERDMPNKFPFVNRKVFWVDPAFHRKKYHTSDWKIIAECKNDEIVIFTDGTEALTSECFI